MEVYLSEVSKTCQGGFPTHCCMFNFVVCILRFCQGHGQSSKFLVKSDKIADSLSLINFSSFRSFAKFDHFKPQSALINVLIEIYSISLPNTVKTRGAFAIIKNFHTTKL